MQIETTSKIAGRASARGIDDLSAGFEALALNAHGLTCVAELLHEKAAESLRCDVSAFLLMDCLERSRALLKQVAHLNGAFHKLVMVEPTPAPDDDLEIVITKWREAHEKWLERVSLGDNSDGPEAKADDLATEALLNFKCRTHAEVQRKLSMFLNSEGLLGLGEAYSDTFLPTLIIPEGGAA